MDTGLCVQEVCIKWFGDKLSEHCPPLPEPMSLSLAKVNIEQQAHPWWRSNELSRNVKLHPWLQSDHLFIQMPGDHQNPCFVTTSATSFPLFKWTTTSTTTQIKYNKYKYKCSQHKCRKCKYKWSQAIWSPLYARPLQMPGDHQHHYCHHFRNLLPASLPLCHQDRYKYKKKQVKIQKLKSNTTDTNTNAANTNIESANTA